MIALELPKPCPICKNNTYVDIMKANKYCICCPCGWALKHSKGGDSKGEAINWWNNYVENRYSK